MWLLFYDCQINSKDRQNRQHSVKTDESKLVLKHSFIMFALLNINKKQKKELCLWMQQLQEIVYFSKSLTQHDVFSLLISKDSSFTG